MFSASIGKTYVFQGIGHVGTMLVIHHIGYFIPNCVWRVVNNHKKIGPPTNAVITPTGNSLGLNAVRASVSAIITIVVNITLIPVLGYMGSAWANFACYFSMMFISYLWGRKVYKVDYNIKKILIYSVLAISLFFVSVLLHIDDFWLRILINTILFGIFISIVYFSEKNNLSARYK